MDLYKKVEKSITFDGSYKLYPAGSIIRGKENPKDIDVILVSSKIDGILQTLDVPKDDIKLVIHKDGERYIAFTLIFPNHKRVKVDVWSCFPKEYPFFRLAYGAGREYNVRIRAVAKSRGYLLNNHGIYHKDTMKQVKKNFKTVSDIQKFLGITERDITKL